MHQQACKTHIPPYGLVDAAGPSSECPASVVRNSESPNEPRCTPPPMSPLAHQEMRSSAGAAAATACSEGITFVRKPGGASQREAKRLVCPW